jgi:hypothetical protein
MQKAFKLEFASIPGASNRDCTWILEPLTEHDYSRASNVLNTNWRDGITSSSNRREIFTFKNSQATIENVLDDLLGRGILQDEIEVTRK